MSTQDPYGTSDQPPRTGSSPASGGSQQPSWQQSAPSGPSGQGYPAGPPQDQYRDQGQGHPQGYQQPAPHGDGRGAQGGYPAYPGQGGYDRPAPRNGVGLAALILGILALLSGFFVIGGLLGLVAIVLGVIGSRRAKRGLATNRGMAITGIVLGLLAVVLSVIAIVFFGFIGSRAANCNTFLESQDQAGYQQCLEEQLGVQTS
ncbi:DUF4190 domain-containing protein [Quadrisphaera sp. KR29]|uniref:DUF4190 domain-containing protein n=1 Tax=Quadrisphaera sp. KR29 TaxID=3461391 RepID=UPI0040444D01